MMNMILQVGAVPMGFTSSDASDSEEPIHTCGYCHHHHQCSFLFPSQMPGHTFTNPSPLPDLIQSNTPTPSPQPAKDVHRNFFPSNPSPLTKVDCFPPTPSPTPPASGECPGCRAFRNDPKDWNDQKVELKLEHIQAVRQKLQQEEENQQQHLLQNYCRRQLNLPQLSWGLPKAKRIRDEQVPQDEQVSLDSRRTSAMAESPTSPSSNSELQDRLDEGEGLDVIEWRRIGGELRMVADTFHLNHSSNTSRSIYSLLKAAMVLPSLSYALSASLIFLLSWRLISKYG